MANTKKITINALSAVVQVAITALLYFFLYKYLLTELGVEQLGVWSLILSFSSIANLANLGITSGLVKFVADYLAEKEEHKIGKLIFTSFVTMSILFVTAGLVVFFLSNYFLHLVVDEQFLDVAFLILPFSLMSLILNAISGIFTSVLEGFQKNYLRNFIYVFSGIIMFALTLFLTPVYQLKGVAMAQVVQSLFIFFVALGLVFKINAFNRFPYWKWSTALFKELFNYGYKFQIVSICQLLCEPTTKLLLSRFGGMAMLGHYEMASRLVNQVRALLVNANQVVIPVVAETIKTKTKEEFRLFFKKMNQLLLLFTAPLLTLILVATPLISLVWIGELNDNFIFAMFVLIIGTGFNIMNGPVYFSCLGEGRLGILVISHIAMATINFALGWLLGLLWGGFGVITAWSLALIVSALFLIIVYGRKKSVGIFFLFPKNEKLIIIITFWIVTLCAFIFTSSQLGVWAKTIIPFILILSYTPVLLKNENTKELIIKRLKNRFL